MWLESRARIPYDPSVRTRWGAGLSWGVHRVRADCPNCELWLHRSEFTAPREQRHSHYHTTDEIIVILQGAMMVGNRALNPGTALAIDTHTPYGFGAPGAGLTFLNFRATDSSNVQMPPEGEKPPYNERDHFRANAVTA